MKCLTTAYEVSFYPVIVHKMNLQRLRKVHRDLTFQKVTNTAVKEGRELTWWEMVMKLKTAAGRREFWTCGADQSCPQWELRWRLDNSFGDEDVFVFVFVFVQGVFLTGPPLNFLSVGR